MQSRMIPVQSHFAGENAEMLTLIWNEVGEQLLQDILGQDPRQMNPGYVQGAIMSIVVLNACVVTVVCCLVESKNPGGYRQKEKTSLYRRILDTVKEQLIGSLKGIHEALVSGRRHSRENVLGGGQRRKVVTGVLRIATSVCRVPSVKKTFMSVNEKGFRTYVMDLFGYVNECEVGKFIEDVCNELLGVSTQRHDVYVEAE